MLAWSRPYVGPFWAMSAPCWAHVEPFRCILWFCWLLLGTSWDHIGLILGHFGPWWHHIRVMLSLFCPCKAFARNIVNTSKKYTFWSRCWWSLLPFLGYVCFFALGAVLSMQGVCKKHRKYQQRIHFLVSLLMVFAPFFGLCVFLSFGVCCT